MVNLETSNYWDNFLERAQYIIDGNRPQLDRLTIHLTSKCNLDCKYCNMKDRSTTLNPGVVKKIISEYCKMNGTIIHFTGGEPTVLGWLPEIINYAHDCGLKISLNTNGVNKLKDISKISKLKCSLDGHENLDEEYGCENILDTIKDTLSYYNQKVDSSQIMSVTVVLSKKNWNKMIEIAQYIRQNFQNIYNIYFSVYKGTKAEYLFTKQEIRLIWKNEIPKVVDLFKRTNDMYSLKQLQIYEKNDFVDGVRFNDNKVIPCYLQLSELTIGTDYKVYNCSHLYRDGEKCVPLMDIRKDSLLTCYSISKKSCENLVPLSKYCLTGCNRNLCNFNKYVHNKLQKK